MGFGFCLGKSWFDTLGNNNSGYKAVGGYGFFESRGGTVGSRKGWEVLWFISLFNGFVIGSFC